MNPNACFHLTPRLPWAFPGGALCPALVAPGSSGAPLVRVYVGTTTGPESASQGIYLCHLNPDTGELRFENLAAKAERPGFVALHPSGRFLYAVTAPARLREQGQTGVAAFAVEAASGRLKLLNEVPSMGTGSTHVSLDSAGRAVLVANYASGSVASFPVREDGSLGEAVSVFQHAGSSVHPERQTGPHAHSLYAAPGDRFALGADLGTDKIMIYRLDPADARLSPHQPPFVQLTAGAGPRHLAFHPNERRLFALNELNSTLTLFDWDGEAGQLKELATLPSLPRDFSGANTTAEVAVHPSGRFVYASNRGHDSIALFRYRSEGDLLEAAGQESTRGGHPRHFNIDPSGRWLIAANRDSDALTVFAIDQQEGDLRFTGHSVGVPRPTCVKFLPFD